jgi:hypothetical protein
MNFLRSHGLFYTSIDAPEDNSIVPSFIEATGDQVYVRFHGKNCENGFKRNITAAERFKYLYSERELQSLYWVGPGVGSVTSVGECSFRSTSMVLTAAAEGGTTAAGGGTKSPHLRNRGVGGTSG